MKLEEYIEIFRKEANRLPKEVSKALLEKLDKGDPVDILLELESLRKAGYFTFRFRLKRRITGFYGEYCY